MIGDKLNIKQKHRQAAGLIFDAIGGSLSETTTFTVAGQSGAGKSEVAQALATLLDDAGHKTFILQQDDYFHYPPRTNHKRRVDDIAWVGTQEVQLKLLDEHLAVFKGEGTSILEKPLVIFEEDRVTTEKIDVSPFDVLIADGTYTTLLQNVDYRIFIDRDYHDTREDRKERGRETIDDFSERIMNIEDGIIGKHRALADIIINKDFTIKIVERS